ncbi:MAG: hypothetical protein KGL39_20410 [Patescibacteria group bacterium]|nr:hypothetical protein [Patescibacteria group bacterium]
MGSPQAILIAVAVAGLWYAGSKTADGIKHVNHAIAAKFHHHKQAPALGQKEDR